MSSAPQAALSIIAQVADGLRSAKSKSLIQYTRVSRVEPIVLIQDDLVHHDFIPDVMQSLSSLFSGYYLMAAALSTNVGSVNTIQLLDKLNPRRSSADAALDAAARLAQRNADSIGLEDYDLSFPDYSVSMEDEDGDTARNARRARLGRDVAKGLRENHNLSVGRLLEVEISENGSSATIPVAVRLMTKDLNTEQMVSLLSSDAEDTGMVARYHKWRSGEIEFVRDVLLCQDVIDRHRRNLIKDKEGIYESIHDRKSQNRISGMLTLQPSVGTISSMMVIDTSAAAEVERTIGGRLKRQRTRDRIMEATNTMLLCVVDVEWERITVYHHSIDQPTEMSLKQMKNAGKSNGPDVEMILKSYIAGNNPKF